MEIIKSEIKEIGVDSHFEGEPIMILFNSTAPEGLRDVCVIHDFTDEPNKDMLKKGSKMIFGDQEYMVEDIGGVANETLFDLGHASLYFELAEGEELMPGAIKLTPNKLPDVKVGDVIQFCK